MFFDEPTSSATPISMTAFWRGRPQQEEMQGAILVLDFVSKTCWDSETPKKMYSKNVPGFQFDLKTGNSADCATEMQVVTIVLAVDQ